MQKNKQRKNNIHRLNRILIAVFMTVVMTVSVWPCAYALDGTEAQTQENIESTEDSLEGDASTVGQDAVANESVDTETAEEADALVNGDFQVLDVQNVTDESNGDVVSEEGSEESEEPVEPEEPELNFKTLYSRYISAASLGINLRTMIGEPNAGYAVAQGAATDGTYAYYMMVKSSNQKGRVVKTTLDGRLVQAGPVIGIHHSNGMTYNSKTHELVSVGYDQWRQQLSFIDPETLTLKYQKNVSYPDTFNRLASQDAYKNGIAAIAYVEKYNVYLARSRGYCDYDKTGTNSTIHNIWVFDADTLEAIGHINTTSVAANYPTVWQSMDADEKYVYYLVSPGKNQPHNVVICLDWNSEMLDPVLKGEKDYIEDMWYCNDDGSGKPDAVMTLSIKKESEGLFHTTSVDEEGNVSNHFYVSEYKGVQKYKTVTKKVKYKVKWKKVKKKVKWKRVKIKKGKNKGKYKWKYKKKKVWKYKTKYKKVKYTVKDYKARDVYVYDLGVF